jgi:hypothetical protein
VAGLDDCVCAIDDDDRSRDVAGGGQAQERDDRGDLLGCPGAPKWR